MGQPIIYCKSKVWSAWVGSKPISSKNVEIKNINVKMFVYTLFLHGGFWRNKFFLKEFFPNAVFHNIFSWFYIFFSITVSFPNFYLSQANWGGKFTIFIMVHGKTSWQTCLSVTSFSTHTAELESWNLAWIITMLVAQNLRTRFLISWLEAEMFKFKVMQWI